MTTPTDAVPSSHPRPFLLVQTRPEDDAAAAEVEAVQRLGGYPEGRLRVLRLDRVVQRPDVATHGLDWEAELADVAAVILPGSPFTGTDPEETKSPVQRAVEAELGRMLDVVRRRDLPFLGCCYGVGTLGRHAGGVVDNAHGESAAPVEVTLTDEGVADPLLAGVPRFTASSLMVVVYLGLVVSGLAVFLGRKLADRLPIPLIRRVAAVLFVVFAVVAAVETVRTLTG